MPRLSVFLFLALLALPHCATAQDNPQTKPTKPTLEEIGYGQMTEDGLKAFNQADEFHTAKKYAEAESGFRESMRLDADSAYPVTALAKMFEEQKKWKEEMEICKEGLRRWPRNYFMQSGLAFALMSSDQFPESEHWYLEAKKNNPYEDSYAQYLGFVLYQEDKYAEAEEQDRIRVKNEPGKAETYESLGTTLLVEEKYDEAESVSRQAIKIDASMGSAYDTIGSCFYAKKKYADAVTWHRDAITRLKNEDDDDRAILAYVHGDLALDLLALGRKKEALAEVEVAKKLGLTDHPVFDQLRGIG